MNMMGESGVVSIKVRLTLILIETFAQESMLTNFSLNGFHSFQNSITKIVLKVMTNKFTGEPAGYGFINFDSDQTAIIAMHRWIYVKAALG